MALFKFGTGLLKVTMLLALVLLFVSNCYLVPTAAHRVDGPFQPENGAQELLIAKYAVDAHNKRAETNLVLESVVEGERQVVVHGNNYRLVIKVQFVSVDYFPHVYEAFVFQGLNGPQDLHLKHFKKLTATKS